MYRIRSGPGSAVRLSRARGSESSCTRSTIHERSLRVSCSLILRNAGRSESGKCGGRGDTTFASTIGCRWFLKACLAATCSLAVQWVGSRSAPSSLNSSNRSTTRPSPGSCTGQAFRIEVPDYQHGPLEGSRPRWRALGRASYPHVRRVGVRRANSLSGSRNCVPILAHTLNPRRPRERLQLADTHRSRMGRERTMTDDPITHSPTCVCAACCAERGGRSPSEVRVSRHWWGARASGGTPAERRAALSKTIKKGAKEYRRTCSRCQNQWYIPKKLASERAPNRLEMAGAKMSSTGANISIVSFSRTRKQLRVQQLEDRQVRVAENTRCPNCGSERVHPRADVELTVGSPSSRRCGRPPAADSSDPPRGSPRRRRLFFVSEGYGPRDDGQPISAIPERRRHPVLNNPGGAR